VTCYRQALNKHEGEIAMAYARERDRHDIHKKERQT